MGFSKLWPMPITMSVYVFTFTFDADHLVHLRLHLFLPFSFSRVMARERSPPCLPSLLSCRVVHRPHVEGDRCPVVACLRPARLPLPAAYIRRRLRQPLPVPGWCTRRPARRVVRCEIPVDAPRRLPPSRIPLWWLCAFAYRQSPPWGRRCCCCCCRCRSLLGFYSLPCRVFLVAASLLPSPPRRRCLIDWVVW